MRARLRRPAGIVLFALLMGCQDRPPVAVAAPPSAVDGAIEAGADPGPPALDAFYRDLARLEAGKLDHLHIVQLGDSHTAADVFTGRLRTRFQGQFGDAGRGMMPPGKTYPGIRQKEVVLAQSGRWIFRNSRVSPEPTPYGLSGFVAQSQSRTASMQVSTADGSLFNTARIGFLYRPGGGRIDILLDGKPTRSVSTDGPPGKPGQVAVSAPAGAHALEVIAKTRDIAITDWAIERSAPGILVEGFGIVGATIHVLDRWSDNAVRQELEALHPSLVIIAYGTNEGFEIGLDSGDYARAFAHALDKVKSWAPRASVLVIGPPDGQRAIGRCTRTIVCHWANPEGLAVVREIERRTALSRGAAFWDWSSVMGPPGSIARWVAAEPPLARPDRVHFTIAGYELAADALFERMMEGFDSYKGIANHPF